MRAYPGSRSDRVGEGQVSRSGGSRTGNDGAYYIDGLSSGPYIFQTSYDTEKGRISIDRKFRLQEGLNVCNIDLSEEGFGEIIGFVYENGNALKDAHLMLWVGYDVKRARSDGTGFYRIKDVPSGESRIIVYYYPEGFHNFFELSRKLTVNANETLHEDFNFSSGTGVLAGSVTCNSEPVHDARLYIQRAFPGFKDSIRSLALTENGYFRAGGLLPGQYFVSLYKPWYMRQEVEVVNNGESLVDFNYTQGDANLKGTVKKPLDTTESGTTYVYLFKPGTCPWVKGEPSITPSFSEGLFTYMSVHRNDEFKLEGLPAGTFDIVAMRSKDEIVAKIDLESITLHEGETLEIALDVGE